MASRWRRAVLVAIPIAACLTLLDPFDVSIVEAQKPNEFYVYVGNLTSSSALIAWGTTHGDGNTIGLASKSYGKADLTIGGQTISESDRNWILVRGLNPDTVYTYALKVNGKAIGTSTIRTYPVEATRMTFFVIGDWGSGDSNQDRVAKAMEKEFKSLQSTDNPVRFILTTGDNLYGNEVFGILGGGTGDKDSHWDTKFFQPYREMLRSIPFYPSLGNHDGDESEHYEDIVVYLDNFFFPDNKPARYYRFGFADLADFFALDTSTNRSPIGGPGYGPESKQFGWFRDEVGRSRQPWKIAYFHHAVYTAGPRHAPRYPVFEHFIHLFEKYNVPVAFSGHEHNFQVSDPNQTGGVHYIVSGAGGELRSKDIRRSLESAKMLAWAPVNHFLKIVIDGDTMRIYPISKEPVEALTKDGKYSLPVVIRRPQTQSRESAPTQPADRASAAQE